MYNRRGAARRSAPPLPRTSIAITGVMAPLPRRVTPRRADQELVTRYKREPLISFYKVAFCPRVNIYWL